jgi:hypothetical protein
MTWDSSSKKSKGRTFEGRLDVVDCDDGERERERERGRAFLLLYQAGTQETAANNTPLTPLHRASSRHVLPSKIMGIASIWLLALQVPCKQFLFFLYVDWRPLRTLQVIPSLFFLGPVCLLESSFLLKSEFRGKWIPGKWIPGKYFPMFGSVMENKLENTFQCLVMSWKMSWKITY